MKKIVKSMAVFATSAAIVALPVFTASAAETSNTTVNVTVNDALTISSDANLNLNLTPTATGVMSYGTSNVTVSTNNSGGYALSVTTNANHSELRGANYASNNLAKISSSTGTYSSPQTMTANTWGYRVTGMTGNGPVSTSDTDTAMDYNWAGVPNNTQTGSTLKTTSSAASNNTTAVVYGVSANLSTPNDSYSGTVVYTAVNN